MLLCRWIEGDDQMGGRISATGGLEPASKPDSAAASNGFPEAGH